MAAKPYSLKAFLVLQKFLLTRTWNKIYFERKVSSSHASQSQFNRHPFLANGLEILSNTNKTLMFHIEGVLLKSSSIFPYFLLVAFEAGGPLRAFILFLLYPIICLVGKEWGLKIMVFVCFMGLKEGSFSVGRNVLPKFFLEEVGNEGFEMMMKWRGSKIGVTDMPRVMVECFLKDYLKVEAVVGREMKVVCGRFIGLIEEKKPSSAFLELSVKGIAAGACGSRAMCQKQPLAGVDGGQEPRTALAHACEVLYMVNEADKKNQQALPREKYPKPLIFHDGRLGFRPTPVATLFMFMWMPFGIFLLIVRATVFFLLPYKFSMSILCFTGLKGTLIRPSSVPDHADDHKNNHGGALYVCNHRTLLDPIYVSMGLVKPLSAVTYSLSRVTELFAPIKTVRLTRNREQDSKMIEKQLKQGDLVICPEGTTCREPYLLRLSPLFAEISDEIVPVAIDFQASMFYGTTASGFKFLDPVFLLMNPTSHCSARFLGKLPKSFTCQGGGKSKFEVANHVQSQIAKALNFECTSLTRKDKYMILAGRDWKWAFG
ncbi:hypothetical protein DITRI_Ditri06bG0176000 [Diplodiscus trichospermus]